MNAVDYSENGEVETTVDPELIAAAGQTYPTPIYPELAADDTLAVHQCHVHPCDEVVVPEKLMCGPHWKMVPKALQRRVLEHYREGQCADKRPSPEYLVAARTAINAVEATVRAQSEALAGLKVQETAAGGKA